MSRNALIIFARPAELGKVKTRIAATLGNEKALQIYQSLLQHTLQVTAPLPIAKFVFYAGDMPEHDLWSAAGYDRLQQQGADLGERMTRAFQWLFDQQFEKICIIGSDCFELTTDILSLAFEKLSDGQLVIGPARDGGYYLLGLTRSAPELFTGICWSTDSVFAETLVRAQKAGFQIFELPLLSDIDEAADIPLILRQQ